jgi:amidase
VGADPGRLRIALTTQPPDSPFETHPDCVQAAEDAGRLLESLGHSVEPGCPSALYDPSQIPNFLVRWTSAVAAGLAFWSLRTGKEIGREDVEPLTWALAEKGQAHSAADYLLAIGYAQFGARAVAEWWIDYDLLVTPTMGAPPAELGTIGNGADDEDPAMPIVRSIPYAGFTAAFNAIGQPAISLPLHWNDEGLPIGVQLAAPFGREDLLLRVASQLEEARPWAERTAPGFAASG